MGGYKSSDSEEEKKKRKKKKKKRSRSRSASIESRHSTKQKKSKKKKKKRSYSRSVSRSPDRFGRERPRGGHRSRSRSRSYGRRSRSRSRDKLRHRSRSPSRGRYSRSRSRERRRRRSRSRSYDSHSRSSRRSSRSPSRKDKRKSKEREDPCLSIPGFTEMAPADQAKIRMQMALKAAAAADEKIKGDSRVSSSTSLADSMAFSQAIQDIESTGFSATSFKSSRGDRREEKMDPDLFTFGTAGELRLDSSRKPVLVDIDKEDLAHPSLYTDPEVKLDAWIQRLTLLRRKKLEGDALT